WTNIEFDLERLERGDMKKRLIFFRWLAAASVIFALGVTGAALYFITDVRPGNSDMIAQQQDRLPDPSPQVASPNTVVPPTTDNGASQATATPSPGTAAETASPEPEIQQDTQGDHRVNGRLPDGHATSGDASAETVPGIQPADQMVDTNRPWAGRASTYGVDVIKSG